MRAFNENHSSENETPKQILELHSEGAQRVAREQDELSADVQELIQLETNDKVIQFLAEAEELMAGATDRLEDRDTSGPTIAIETEIIEKIADAAEQKQQSGQGQGKQNGALMQMLQQMMQGKSGDAKPNGKQGEGQEAGSKGGEGQEAESDSANSTQDEASSGNSDTRRLPKKSGSAGTSMPKEFQKALEAYNKGIETK